MAATAVMPAWAEDKAMITRAIPKTGEQLPVVGLGTWQTFDVGVDKKDKLADIDDVLRRLLDAGGRVIDSSPMYGRAEEVTGDELDAIGATGKPFLATKVWTAGQQEGTTEMRPAVKRLR